VNTKFPKIPRGIDLANAHRAPRRAPESSPRWPEVHDTLTTQPSVNLLITKIDRDALGQHVRLLPNGTRMHVEVRDLDTRGDFKACGRGEIGRGWNERVRGGAAVLVDEEATDRAGLCGREVGTR